MQGSLDESAAKFEDPDVLARVSDLERRVAALENLSGVQPALKPDEVLLRNLPPVPARSVPIVGRALLGLAGAYLLRAIAESGTAPRTATVIVALLYAGAWLVSPIRTRGAETFRAIVYTVTAALIFAPLVWETTVRFQVLSPAAAALVLVLFVIAGNAVAWRRNLDAIGRIAMLAGAGTALGLLVATRDLAPFTIALLAMALTAEYAACRDRLTGERWIAAVSADASLLFLTYILTRPQGLPEGYRAVPAVLAVAIQAAALAIYLGAFHSVRLRAGSRSAWFEVGQLSAVFAISIGGALQVTRGSAAAIVGGFCMLSGAGAYLTALVLLDRRTGRRNFYAYATWGLALLLAGGAILFSGIVLTAIWSALAILAMTVGRRTGLVVLRAHASVYMALLEWFPGCCDFACRRASHPRPACRRSPPPPSWPRAPWRCVMRHPTRIPDNRGPNPRRDRLRLAVLEHAGDWLGSAGRAETEPRRSGGSSHFPAVRRRDRSCFGRCALGARRAFVVAIRGHAVWRGPAAVRGFPDRQSGGLGVIVARLRQHSYSSTPMPPGSPHAALLAHFSLNDPSRPSNQARVPEPKPGSAPLFRHRRSCS